MLGLLVVLSAITYLDRICIGVAGPRMQDELGISPERWGWVLGAFLLAYGILEIPMGALGDRVGPRRVLGRIVIWWSLFTAATGAVSSFGSLVATRFLFGAGEAGAYPNVSAVIARDVAPAGRARAQGAVWSASRVGGALAPLAVLPLQAAFGWRASFFVFGVLGALWVPIWLIATRPTRPERAPELQPVSEPVPAPVHDQALIPAPVTARAPSSAAAPASFRSLITSPPLRRLMLMYFCYVWGAWFYFSWFQTFLVKGRGFSNTEMGAASAAGFLLGAAGNVVGGTLADALGRRWGAARARRIVGGVALSVTAACLAGAALAPAKALLLAFALFGFFAMDVMLPCAWATATDLGGARAGAVSGAMNSAGQLGGFVCSIAFGRIAERHGGYDVALLVVSGMVAVAALLFFRLGAGSPRAVTHSPPQEHEQARQAAPARI